MRKPETLTHEVKQKHPLQRSFTVFEVSFMNDKADIEAAEKIYKI